MRQPVRLGAMLVVLSLGAILSNEARAEPTAGDRAAAQTLFDGGMALMREGRHAEACPKLQESQRLDPAIGTLFNLSDCYERVGKLASAWAGFREVADRARIEKQKKREQAAAARAEALRPRLSTLTIEVQGASSIAGIQVKRDGVDVGSGQWGTPLPVDPGEHEIVASAPGKETVTRTVLIDRDAQAEVVAIPPLGSAQSEVLPPPPAAPPAPSDRAQSPPPSTTAVDSGQTASRSSGSSQRTWAYVLGGTGLVGLGASAFFALQAKSRYDDSVDRCSSSDKNRCDAEGLDLRNDARSSGNYATIAFGLGAAALTGGIVLWAAAPADSDASPAAHGVVMATPIVARDGSGIVVQGAF